MSEAQALIHEHLFERAPIMIAVLDESLRIVEANERFGRSFPNWPGRRCHDVLKNAAEACDGCNVRRSFRDGRARIHEERLALGERGSRRFVTRVAPLFSGAAKYMVWMASEVTEAASLQHENEVLFERVPCYVVVLDRELRIVRANRRMRETFGGHRGEHCYRVFKRREAPCSDCPAMKVFDDGADHTSEHVGVTATGEQADYIVTASALSYGEQGNGPDVAYVIEMSADVTEMRRLEREKLEAERLAAVGETVSGLAHGIKNILMGMEGGMYVLSTGFDKNDRQRVSRGLEMLNRNVGRVSGLTRNLLSFSKGTVPEVALADVNQIAREVAELYVGMAQSAGIVVKMELGEGIPRAPLDASGIHTCLANLVSNAIDACQASDTGGRAVVIRTSEEGGVLCLEVSDNGSGMDYEVKKKIFTTFFTTKGAGGTGLGLLLTRKIVQEHGGRIAVESEPGRGTTFRILLPRSRLPRVGAGGDLERSQANPSVGHRV
jgi:signal transduction histidine kinase